MDLASFLLVFFLGGGDLLGSPSSTSGSVFSGSSFKDFREEEEEEEEEEEAELGVGEWHGLPIDESERSSSRSFSFFLVAAAVVERVMVKVKIG